MLLHGFENLYVFLLYLSSSWLLIHWMLFQQKKIRRKMRRRNRANYQSFIFHAWLMCTAWKLSLCISNVYCRWKLVTNQWQKLFSLIFVDYFVLWFQWHRTCNITSTKNCEKKKTWWTSCQWCLTSFHMLCVVGEEEH